jgi:hypothetical protein
MKHCIQSTTIDRQGQAALGDWRRCSAKSRPCAWCGAADCGAMRSVIAGNDPNDLTAILDPVPNYLAGMTRGLRVGVDSARCCCRCNPLWIT